jgi:hypothetical protein
MPDVSICGPPQRDGALKTWCQQTDLVPTDRHHRAMSPHTRGTQASQCLVREYAFVFVNIEELHRAVLESIAEDWI